MLVMVADSDSALPFLTSRTFGLMEASYNILGIIEFPLSSVQVVCWLACYQSFHRLYLGHTSYMPAALATPTLAWAKDREQAWIRLLSNVVTKAENHPLVRRKKSRMEKLSKKRAQVGSISGRRVKSILTWASIICVKRLESRKLTSRVVSVTLLCPKIEKRPLI